MSNTTYRVLVEKLGGSDATQFVGDEGEVFYDPTGNVLRLSDGTTPGGVTLGGGGGGQSNSWVRPTDWLEMPEVLETEEKFVGLFAVYDLPENFIALYFEGDYTVDWGDGTVENFNSGDTAQHSYAWSDIPSNTLTTEGYRQVLVTVTPQSGQNLTIMDLTVRHDNINNGDYINTPWLDLAVSMPNADSGGSLRFCGYEYGLNSNSYLFDVQRISIIHAGGMTDFTECFYYFTSLRRVEILNSPSADDFTYLFDYCTALTDIVLSDTSSVTNMYGMFSSCYALTTVPEFDTSSVTNMYGMFSNCYALTSVPLFDTSSVTNMGYMFNYCTALTSVPLFDTSSVTGMNFMFSYCSALTSVPLFDTSSVTNMGYMFSNCYALTSVPLFDTSSVAYMQNMFTSCVSLQIAALNGTKVNISYQNCLLGRQAIVDIFNGLATVSGKTIIIANNYGVADLISTDYDIATDKGWSVTT
jgi:surface protein